MNLKMTLPSDFCYKSLLLKILSLKNFILINNSLTLIGVNYEKS